MGAFVRLSIVGVLLMLIFIAMANLLTENLIHELVGSLVILVSGYHIYINFPWFKSLFKGKYNLNRLFVALWIFTLIGAIVALFVSSVMISVSLFSFLNIDSGIQVQAVHTAAGYWLIVLGGIHLGSQWQRFSRMVKRLVSKFRMAPVMPVPVLALLVIVITCQGVYSMQERDLLTKLFKLNAFSDYWDFDEAILMYFVHLFAIFALFVLGGIAVSKLFHRR